jgi:nucleotide-binding universal stress UspA family protein
MYPYTEYVIADRVGVRLSSTVEAQQEAAREQMEELKQKDFLRGVSLETGIGTGSAIDEICGEASQADVDLVVTSTHGRTGFKHALIGSVAEHVVRYAERPVVVVPSRSRAES